MTDHPSLPGDRVIDRTDHPSLPGDRVIDRQLAWAQPDAWPAVRWVDGDAPADPVEVKRYAYPFLTAKTIDPPPGSEDGRGRFRADDLHRLAEAVFAAWMAGGAPAKQRGALLFHGVHSNDADIDRLRKQMDDWSDSARGAMAADAARAMALNGGRLALMTLDNVANKFKNKMVRRAAREAFDAIAQTRGITPDQLADRIVPDLGFDRKGERAVDFGARVFTAYVTPSLDIRLRDADGKPVKSLPKPGAKDDTEKAEAAKTEFAAVKKQYKVVIGIQTARLDNALSSGREWDADAWRALFMDNPLMRSFAMGLVWGFYAPGADAEARPLATFRLLDDGGLADAEENTLNLADHASARIRLVHPLEFSDGEKNAWRAQLADYEIAQPLPQLDRPVYRVEDNERDAVTLDRFAGLRLAAITLRGKLDKLGWNRGSVLDAGGFSSAYKEFTASGVAVWLEHSVLYFGMDVDDRVTVGQAAFYTAGTVRIGSYEYDTPKNLWRLGDVPPRLFSEVVLNLSVATSTAQDRDEAWEKELGPFPVKT